MIKCFLCSFFGVGYANVLRASTNDYIISIEGVMCLQEICNVSENVLEIANKIVCFLIFWKDVRLSRCRLLSGLSYLYVYCSCRFLTIK